MSLVLAIDPGPTHSAWVLVDPVGYKPLAFAKNENTSVRRTVRSADYDHLVIEEAISRRYSGRSVSDTAFEAGRFAECSSITSGPYFHLVSRSKVRGHICKGRGNDSKVIEGLICMFEPKIYYGWQAKNVSRRVMINQSKKGFFKGFKADIWQAFALAVTFINIEGV